MTALNMILLGTQKDLELTAYKTELLRQIIY